MLNPQRLMKCEIVQQAGLIPVNRAHLLLVSRARVNASKGNRSPAMCKFALAFFSLLVVIASPAAASGNPQAHWLVTQLSGDARVIHPGLQPASLKVNGELAPGDTLLTGPTGRATLVRGADYIVVAPASELKLPYQQ